MCGVSADDVEVIGLSGVCGQLTWRVGSQLAVFDKMPQQPQNNPEEPESTKPTETNEDNGKNDTIVSSEGLGNQYETSEYKGALSEAGEENRKVNNNNPGTSVTTDDTWVDYTPGQQPEQGTQPVDETQNQAQDLSDQGSAGQNDLNGAFEAMNRIYDSTSGNGQ
jgi:pyruvate/2-oxoglutarate dehydrogenase complex dihydrolipoamide acyltransferase (E2) component